MLREVDLNKKQTDSDFTRSLPSQPGKKFKIKKRLERLRDIKNPGRKNNTNNNNSNNNNNAGSTLFPPGPGDDRNLFPPELGPPPPAPNIDEFIPSPLPQEYELQNRFNRLTGTSSPPSFFANNAPNFRIPAQTYIFSRRSGASGPPPANNFLGHKQLP